MGEVIRVRLCSMVIDSTKQNTSITQVRLTPRPWFDRWHQITLSMRARSFTNGARTGALMTLSTISRRVIDRRRRQALHLWRRGGVQVLERRRVAKWILRRSKLYERRLKRIVWHKWQIGKLVKKEYTRIMNRFVQCAQRHVLFVGFQCLKSEVLRLKRREELDGIEIAHDRFVCRSSILNDSNLISIDITHTPMMNNRYARRPTRWTNFDLK